MLTRIYLDIDGVCNSIFAAWLRANGCKIESDADWPIRGSGSVVRACHLLLSRQGVSEADMPDCDTFWSNCGYEVFADAPPSAECFGLLRYSVELVGVQDVFFCTKPSRNPQSAAGKLEWIRRNAPPQMQQQYHLTAHKYDLARPTRLLIDDSQDNVDEFRAAGGRAILWPRPWNARHLDNTSAAFSELRSFGPQYPPDKLAALQSVGLVPRGISEEALQCQSTPL